MKRLSPILFLCAALGACNDGEGTSAPDDPNWSAEVEMVDATSDAGLLVQVPGSTKFMTWNMEQPIPAGSRLKTPKSVRATVGLPHHGLLTLNHSTEVELAESRRLVVARGQVVLAYPGGAKEAPVHVVLPQAEVTLRGTKVGFVVGEVDSAVTVSQGRVDVTIGEATVTAGPGQEVVVRADQPPVLTYTPELGRRMGWAEIGERDSLDVLPDVPRGLGKLVGKVPGEGETEHRMELLNHSVDVKIQGNLAYTEIHESFQNKVNKTLEGIYRFPLPPDARISRLSLKVGDKWMEGEFLDTDRADKIWNDVKKPVKKRVERRMKKVVTWEWVNTWRDPALLKWKEGNTFELRIFPIPAQEIREVKIGYVERLHPSSGGYSYTYPMPVDRAGLIPAKRFEFNAELYGHDATQSLEVAGYDADVQTAATRDDVAMATIKWAEDDFVARGDFDIRFGRRDAVGLRTSTYSEQGKDPYAVFVIRPDLPVVTEIKPRDFVIVLDRSFSRTGAALEAQRQLVPRMLREMDPLDRVAVVACNETCVPIGNTKFQQPRNDSAEAVITALDGLTAQGATYPIEAVRVAADLLRRRAQTDREAHVVYFTDGVASVGELRPGRVGEAVRRVLSPFDARMSVVDLGGDIDNLLLDALASAGRGRVVTLDPMLSMTGQALDILNGHYRSILERPELSLPPGVVSEGTLPNAIAAGDEIVVAARFPNAIDGEFRVDGTLGAEAFSMRYPAKLRPSIAEGNTFVPGEWATQRITGLELAADSNRDEIVELSTTYGVLSRHTSLLALESDQMMAQYKVEKRERTQWTGEEAAEETVTRQMPRPKRKSASRREKPMMTSAPKSAESSSRASLDPFDGGGGGGVLGGDLDSFRPQPRRRARGRMVQRTRFVPMRPVAMIKSATATTSWERKNVTKKLERLQRDPGNRTRRMDHIRALIRARDIEAAHTATTEWLTANPMDPEARVQFAQLQAQRGDLAAFYAGLVEALEAAPRGRWLQERVHSAATARGDEPLACAMKLALEATQKKEAENAGDNLACPMTTVTGLWFGDRGPTPTLPIVSDTRLKGDLTVSLSSSGGDWDIVLLEPSGRPLWWGSARRNLEVSNVVGPGVERLAVPKLRDGTYSIMAIPRTGKAGDSLQIQIRTHSGESKTVRVTAPSEAPFEVAEVLRTWK